MRFYQPCDSAPCPSVPVASFYPYFFFFILFLLSGAPVYSQVGAAFSIDISRGCVPLTVRCTSTENEGVVRWQWTTSDKQTSTDTNAVFTFTRPGRYRIKLRVSDNASADSAYRDVVANGIPTDFTYSYNDICTSPVPVQFQSYDTTAEGNYRWDFGDSSVSILPSPAHVYRQQGIYTVKLITTSKEGCVDSVAKLLQTGLVSVDFSAPQQVCSNTAVNFTSSSTSEPKSASWTINNVEVSRSVSGFSYSFPFPGTYTIRLTEDFGGCTFSKERQLTVRRRPSAAFEASGTLQSCVYPSTVQFNNTSQDADSYVWQFGDNVTSTQSSPSHEYTTGGQYSPMLIASNNNGCADTVTQTNLILLGPPIISGFTGLPASQCLPYSISPSVNVAAPEPIVFYQWDFGDGASSNDSVPTHTYTKQGYYDVTLWIQTQSGCTDTFVMTRAVSVGDSVFPSFTVDRGVACGSDTFHFTGSATGPVNSWTWRFSDGSNTAGGSSPSHVFLTTGPQSVSLEVNNNGCRIRTTQDSILVVKPPIADIKLVYDCSDRLTVNLSDASQGAETWLWDYGDGSPVSVQQNPGLHEYPASGFYTVRLATTASDCASTDTFEVAVLNTKPEFTFDPADGFICRKSGLWMTSSYPEYIQDYYWDFDDEKSAFSDTAIYHHYTDAGVYRPSLVAKFLNGCYDTLYSPQPVTVTGPTASFATSQASWCKNDEVLFTDSSVTDGVHDIIQWEWSSGDAFTEVRATPQFSRFFAEAGSYPTRLIVTDNNRGCTDTAYYTVLVNELPVVSAGPDSFNCEGSSLLLQASGALRYLWNADTTLSCIDCDAPLAAPVQGQRYYVTGTDANNCKNTDSVAIEVIHPFTLAVGNNSFDICQLDKAALTASGAELYSWTPAAGLSDTSVPNPVATPTETTTYTVTGRDSHFCFEQKSDVTVNVHPIPLFDITDTALSLHRGDVTVLSTTGSDFIVAWSWSPSAGLSCIDCPQPTLTAIERDVTYVATVTSDRGCVSNDAITVHVLCNDQKIYLPTAFTPNGDGKNDWFYLLSSVDNPVKSFTIFNRSGERIFEKKSGKANNARDGWNGDYPNGRHAAPGVYVYRMEVTCNEQVIPLTGTVTLLR